MSSLNACSRIVVKIRVDCNKWIDEMSTHLLSVLLSHVVAVVSYRGGAVAPHPSSACHAYDVIRHDALRNYCNNLGSPWFSRNAHLTDLGADYIPKHWLTRWWIWKPSPLCNNLVSLHLCSYHFGHGIVHCRLTHIALTRLQTSVRFSLSPCQSSLKS